MWSVLLGMILLLLHGSFGQWNSIHKTCITNYKTQYFLLIIITIVDKYTNRIHSFLLFKWLATLFQYKVIYFYCLVNTVFSWYYLNSHLVCMFQLDINIYLYFVYEDRYLIGLLWRKYFIGIFSYLPLLGNISKMDAIRNLFTHENMLTKRKRTNYV